MYKHNKNYKNRVRQNDNKNGGEEEEAKLIPHD